MRHDHLFTSNMSERDVRWRPCLWCTRQHKTDASYKSRINDTNHLLKIGLCQRRRRDLLHSLWRRGKKTIIINERTTSVILVESGELQYISIWSIVDGGMNQKYHSFYSFLAWRTFSCTLPRLVTILKLSQAIGCLDVNNNVWHSDSLGKFSTISM